MRVGSLSEAPRPRQINRCHYLHHPDAGAPGRWASGTYALEAGTGSTPATVQARAGGGPFRPGVVRGRRAPPGRSTWQEGDRDSPAELLRDLLGKCPRDQTPHRDSETDEAAGTFRRDSLLLPAVREHSPAAAVSVDLAILAPSGQLIFKGRAGVADALVICDSSHWLPRV